MIFIGQNKGTSKKRQFNDKTIPQNVFKEYNIYDNEHSMSVMFMEETRQLMERTPWEGTSFQKLTRFIVFMVIRE